MIEKTQDSEQKDHEPQLEESERRRGLSATVEEYVINKTADKALQGEITERVVSVGLNGAKAVRREISSMFPDQESTKVEGATLSESLKAEQMQVLEGQAEKAERMEEFVDNMSTWANDLVAEFTVLQQDREDLNQEEREKLIADYQDNIQNLVSEATRTITYQDTRASAVSLGDHGWMHLTQDIRDAQLIVRGKRGGVDLSAKEKFMLGLAGAFHDVGYAVPEVSDAQRVSNGRYGSFDKGHPVNSYVFLVSERKKYETILGVDGAEALFQIVANHENPERAELAGDYKELAEAFAQADASAAFGKDKLPPIVVQIPEVLSYLNAIALGENFEPIFDQLGKEGDYAQAYDRVVELEKTLGDLTATDGSDTTQDQFEQQVLGQLSVARQELADARLKALASAKEKFQKEVVSVLEQRVSDKIDDKIKHSAEVAADEEDPLLHQAQAMKNSLTHFGPISLKFLLGRMAAESLPLSVGVDGKVDFTINAGLARELEEEGIIENTVKSSAKLTVKLFLEQAAIKIGDDNLEDAIVKSVASNEAPTLDVQTALKDIGVTVEVTGEPDRSVSLISETVRIVSKTDAGISDENKDFYDNITEQLNVANIYTAKFIEDSR